MKKDVFLYIYSILLLCIISSCCNSFSYLNYRYSYDELSLEGQPKHLKFSNSQSLSGKYLLMNLPGFTGHVLRLQSDSSFQDTPFSDVNGYLEPRSIKGKWSSNSDFNVCLKRGCSDIELLAYSYKNLDFLIPIYNEELFTQKVNLNIDNLNKVASERNELKRNDLMYNLHDFANICYIKRFSHERF